MAQTYSDLSEEFRELARAPYMGVAEIYKGKERFGFIAKHKAPIYTKSGHYQRPRRRKGGKSAWLTWHLKGTRGLRFLVVGYAAKFDIFKLQVRPTDGFVGIYRDYEALKSAVIASGFEVRNG